MRDAAYGGHRRQVDHLVPGPAAPKAVALHLHAGDWPSRDKADFAFLAPAFGRLGCASVLADYPLAAEMGVAAIPEAVRAIAPALFVAAAV